MLYNIQLNYEIKYIVFAFMQKLKQIFNEIYHFLKKYLKTTIFFNFKFQKIIIKKI